MLDFLLHLQKECFNSHQQTSRQLLPGCSSRESSCSVTLKICRVQWCSFHGGEEQGVCTIREGGGTGEATANKSQSLAEQGHQIKGLHLRFVLASQSEALFLQFYLELLENLKKLIIFFFYVLQRRGAENDGSTEQIKSERMRYLDLLMIKSKILKH